jgi:tyrosine-protein kinase
VTGAMDQEGKSTTVANLAVAFARAGTRVIVADLDLRRPMLHRFFDLETVPGLTDVTLGHVSLDQALMPVPGSEDGTGKSAQSANGQGRLLGSLAVLTAGSVPPDPGEFVGTHALTDLLATLESRAELVLLDTPPLLHVGDAITLSAKVGGMIVVINLGRIRRPVLGELYRVLSSCRAEKLGFVLAGADREEGYGYESYGYYEQASATRRGTLTRTDA